MTNAQSSDMISSMDLKPEKSVSLNRICVAAGCIVFLGILLFRGADSMAARSVSPAAIAPADGGPSAGKFLVATERITDPRFRATVVLLIHYDGDGAVGLIVNRPTMVKLSSLLPGIKELRKRSDTAFIGGPVGMKQLFMLVRSSASPIESLPVLQGVYVSTSAKLLERVVREGGKEKFRLYAGYSGWTTGQLEQELSRGDWRILPADAETIFDRDPALIWPDLIRRSSVIRIREERPDDTILRRLSL